MRLGSQVEKTQPLNMFPCSQGGSVKGSVGHFYWPAVEQGHQQDGACQGDGQGTVRSCERRNRSP